LCVSSIIFTMCSRISNSVVVVVIVFCVFYFLVFVVCTSLSSTAGLIFKHYLILFKIM